MLRFPEEPQAAPASRHLGDLARYVAEAAQAARDHKPEEMRDPERAAKRARLFEMARAASARDHESALERKQVIERRKEGGAGVGGSASSVPFDPTRRRRYAPSTPSTRRLLSPHAFGHAGSKEDRSSTLFTQALNRPKRRRPKTPKNDACVCEKLSARRRRSRPRDHGSMALEGPKKRRGSFAHRESEAKRREREKLEKMRAELQVQGGEGADEGPGQGRTRGEIANMKEEERQKLIKDQRDKQRKAEQNEAKKMLEQSKRLDYITRALRLEECLFSRRLDVRGEPGGG